MAELYQRNAIVLDGCMDEPIWETAKEYTDFRTVEQRGGGGLAEVQTVFKILPFEDHVYIGIKCLEPGGMEQVLATRYLRNAHTGHTVEIFLSPSGNSYEYYQFAITINGDSFPQYYSEGGNI